MGESQTFAPRRSWGWLWLLAIGLLVLVPTVGLNLLVPDMPGAAIAINYAVGIPIGLPIIVLAIWFPTMRYELDDEYLTLRYGPILTYQIPLATIQVVQRRTLAVSLWSSVRLPGLALFGVPYADMGVVHMCATACSKDILLIETSSKKYGVTPENEQAFVSALCPRLVGSSLGDPAT